MNNEIFKSNPTPYSYSSTAESDSITILDYILDSNQIKSQLAKNDKTPNIDGYLELVDEGAYPVGKLEIQVKTLGSKNLKKPKYQCKKGFLSYCWSSTLPVLLIVVDCRQEKAYWVHLDHALLESVDIKGETVNINIPINNVVSIDNNAYITDWMRIAQSYRERIVNYTNLKSEIAKVNSDNVALRKATHDVTEQKSEVNKEIQVFLNMYNDLLDRDFAFIKSIFFPDCWKFGFAYQKYEDEHVDYSLYPINFGYNDKAIKLLDYDSEFFKQLNFHCGHFRDNPIKNEPKKTAYKEVVRLLKPIIDNRSLVKISNEIAIEYIVSVIDLYGKKAQLNAKNILFNLEEVEIAFCNFVNTNYDSRFNRQYFLYLIEYLQQNRITRIKRLYPIKNFPESGSYYVFNTLSKLDIKKTVIKVFELLPKLYDSLLEDFFPLLKEDIKFYNNFNKLIINIKHCDDEELPPNLEFIYLENMDNPYENKVDVYLVDEEITPITINGLRKIDNEFIYIDEIKYRCNSWCSTSRTHIFNQRPLDYYMYETLNQRLEHYLKPYFTHSPFSDYSAKIIHQEHPMYIKI